MQGLQGLQEFADYAEATRYIVGYAILSLVFGCIIGYFVGRSNGIKIGRKREYKKWADEMYPEMKRLQQERDQLWRSAVSKKQKLNRLKRNGVI
jgi:hypothetical protein